MLRLRELESKSGSGRARIRSGTNLVSTKLAQPGSAPIRQKVAISPPVEEPSSLFVSAAAFILSFPKASRLASPTSRQFLPEAPAAS